MVVGRRDRGFARLRRRWREGKPSFQDFHFVASISKASPTLFLSCATGVHHKPPC